MIRVIGIGLDLMFSSKVKEECLRSGVEYLSVKTIEKFTESVVGTKLIVINLEASGIDLKALLEINRSIGVKVVGFFSHVNDEALELAERLGIREAVPKSQFVKLLPDWIANL